MTLRGAWFANNHTAVHSLCIPPHTTAYHRFTLSRVLLCFYDLTSAVCICGAPFRFSAVIYKPWETNEAEIKDWEATSHQAFGDEYVGAMFHLRLQCLHPVWFLSLLQHLEFASLLLTLCVCVLLVLPCCPSR